MKTTPTFQKILFVLAALGLALALNASSAWAAAPTAEPPLFPGFTWDNLGAAEQAIYNGETVSVPGTLYQAQEKFDNLEKAPEAFFNFYATPALAQAGWTEIQTDGTATGVSTVYFHESGLIAVVKFAQCADSAAQTCISVWVSAPTTVRPTQQPQTPSIEADPDLEKKAPADSSTNLKMLISLSWYRYNGSGLNRYRYCIDETDDNQCDDSVGWTNAWSNTAVEVTTPKTGKTYYWQVQAVLNDNTKVDADNGDYWTFSTTIFKKVAPVNTARRQKVSVTLRWSASPYKEPDYYQYCISKASITCTSWVNAVDPSVQVNLNFNTTYHWQVRAVAANDLYMEADNGTWWTFSTAKNQPRYDFNGDWKEDIAFYRPSNWSWHILGKTPFKFGQAGDIPVPGDYLGARKAQAAVFRPTTAGWFIQGGTTRIFGKAGDIPVPADYNGNGIVDIAVFRPSTGTWFVRGITQQTFGQTGDIPVPADYSGDGKADLAVFRPSTGQWYISGQSTITLGTAGDYLVPADYNGDEKVEAAIFRPSEGKWYVNGVSVPIAFGQAGDIPVPCDYNGDRKADYAVFRPSTGEWLVRSRGIIAVYGTTGDVPLAPYYYVTP